MLTLLASNVKDSQHFQGNLPYRNIANGRPRERFEEPAGTSRQNRRPLRIHQRSRKRNAGELQHKNCRPSRKRRGFPASQAFIKPRSRLCRPNWVSNWLAVNCNSPKIGALSQRADWLTDGSQCSSAVEQRFRKPSVAGSIPAIGSTFNGLCRRKLERSRLELPAKVPAKKALWQNSV